MKRVISRKQRLWQRALNPSKFDFHKFMASVLVVTIPLMIFCLSANVLMRIGDVYEYNMDSSEIMNHTSLSTSKSEVVNSLTMFMQHRTDEMSLMENVEYEPEELFSDLDRQAMGSARMLLDIMLVIGLLALIITAVCYFLLIRWHVRDIFMKRFKLAVVVLLIMEAVNLIVVTAEPLRRLVYGHFIQMDFPDGDNLLILLSEDFPKQIAIFEAIFAVVVLLIMAYFTWSVAGKRKMFKGNR
jgi:hypothetical protein